MAKRDIQIELRELKYYYSRRKYIDEYASIIGKSKVAELAEIYQTAICQAPIRLYDIFVELYVNNHTWESLADKWSYSTSHIGRQAKELMDYLTAYFEKHQPLPAKGVN